MSAAAFVLAINIFVTALFAVSFGVVAVYQKGSDAARWASAAYGLGVLSVGLEFVVPGQADPRPVGIAIFLSFLFAISLVIIGLARHFRVRTPWIPLGIIWAVSFVDILIIIDWPRDSMLRMVLYQTPYALVMMVGIWVLIANGARRSLELVLGLMFALSALQFLAKPFIAHATGMGSRPQDYILSTYAAYSQTLAAVLLIANGLLLLLILVRDLMEEMTERSETDKLSGLLNRRGFEDRVNSGLASLHRSGLPGAMIIADLDRFKEINDTHGHECGDHVIAAFARVLSSAAGDHFVLGRLGGEEFAVFMPGVEASGARLFGESVRAGFSGQKMDFLPEGVRPTVSIGVAQIERGDSQAQALRRADAALYEAKRAGRDAVRIAPRDADAMPVHPLERRARAEAARAARRA